MEAHSETIKEPITISDIHDFFYHLLTYRISPERTIRLYDRPIEISFKGHAAGYYLIEENINKLKEDIKEIDDMLAQMIDPFEKEFTEYQLIQEYNFPKGDLNKADEDFG
jgi:hypothetical protein